jgi:teichuronic acid exporter
MIATENLKSKVVTASVWAIIAKFSLLITQFVIGIVLARLLKPSDFGLIALTTIFITICTAITDGGFETALIQKKELTTIQINTTFYLNILLGCLMSLILFFLAPFISSFFHESRLNNILRVLSLTLPLEALGQTQRTLLMKELDFKKISLSQILSSIISGIVGIILAYKGYGVWALVYSTILALSIRVLCFWVHSSWYPKAMFSFASLSNLIPFGLNVLATSILFFFVQQFNSIVVGRFYSDRDLGLFNRGVKFPEIIISTIQGVVLKMCLPLFSKFQSENEKLNEALIKTNTLVAFIAFPLLFFVFFNANAIVLMLLTQKWIEAVIYVKLFCIIKVFDPFITIQQELLLAKSKSRLYLIIFTCTSVFEVTSILIFAKYGILYIIGAIIFNRLFQYFIYLFVGLNKVNLRFEHLKQFASYLLISVIVVFSMQMLDYALFDDTHINNTQKLLFDFFIGGASYILLCYKFKNKDVLMIRSIFLSINYPKFRLLKNLKNGISAIGK